MNTNKTVLSIVDKLKPAKKAVELSVVDDIEQNIDRFDQAESEASYLAYEYGDEIMDAFSEVRDRYNLDDYIINGATRDLEEVSEILGQALAELEVKAEELGIEPSDILYNFDDLKARVDNSESLNRDAFEKYQETRQYAGFNDFWR